MNRPLDEQTLMALNQRILRFFLRETRSIGDLFRAEGMERYHRQSIRRAVAALAAANLLDRWGATSGTTYRTSHLGWIILLYLENESSSPKVKNRDEVGIR